MTQEPLLYLKPTSEEFIYWLTKELFLLSSRALLSEGASWTEVDFTSGGDFGDFFFALVGGPETPDFICYGFRKELFLDSRPALDSDIWRAEDLALADTFALDLKLGVKPKMRFCKKLKIKFILIVKLSLFVQYNTSSIFIRFFSHYFNCIVMIKNIQTFTESSSADFTANIIMDYIILYPL